MTRTKKYFILSRALGFCAIGVIALMPPGRHGHGHRRELSRHRPAGAARKQQVSAP